MPFGQNPLQFLMNEDPDLEAWTLLQRLSPRLPGMWAEPQQGVGSSQQPKTPVMSNLDLAGLLGLIPFLLGPSPAGAGVARGMSRIYPRRSKLQTLVPWAESGAARDIRPPQHQWTLKQIARELGLEVPIPSPRHKGQEIRPLRATGRGWESAIQDALNQMTDEALHRLFLKQAKFRHPDVGGSPQDFQRLQDAYQAVRRDRKFMDLKKMWGLESHGQ